MKGKQLKEIAEGLKDDEDIYVLFYDRAEADEYIAENLNQEEGVEVSPLTDEEWLKLVEQMNNDEAIEQEAHESFQYYLDAVFTAREKAKNGN